MKIQLEKLKKEIIDELSKAKDSKVFRDLEIKYLGRKGEFNKILRGLADLGNEEKKTIGQLANDLKSEIAEKFEQAKEIIAKGALTKEPVDVTLPGEKIISGHLHPITQIQNDLDDLFISMGFMVLDGPELESDYYNFEALNIPKFHPARDMQDTFYVDKKNKEGEYDLVMRTHTSPVQIRAMKKYGAPLKCIVPGKCFRSEATDVRHEHTFYQIEGLMIDEKICLSNMKAVLEAVGKFLYGPETKLRLRPKFYPFVEPGVNGEFSCFVCRGQGCRLCKNTGWLEIVGAGMVHPNVLRAGGIDPEKYQGFAFGFGFDRLVMLKYGIDDVRLFNSGDLRFLNQF
jgi:phenylalanyl-tRNA synthetase alpha chain